MINLNDYIESGILELYVLGQTTITETVEIETMSASYPEIRKAIADIEEALQTYALAHAKEPTPVIKPFVLAVIDYTERLKGGEVPAAPPILNSNSAVQDYAEWLNRPDMILPEYFTDLHAKIIGFTPEAMTAILWVKDSTPHEVHEHELERFLIVEGTCDILVEEDIYHLQPGDIFNIPLYKDHIVKVTSPFPCKVILQRIAA